MDFNILTAIRHHFSITAYVADVMTVMESVVSFEINSFPFVSQNIMPVKLHMTSYSMHIAYYNYTT